MVATPSILTYLVLTEALDQPLEAAFRYHRTTGEWSLVLWQNEREVWRSLPLYSKRSFRWLTAFALNARLISSVMWKQLDKQIRLMPALLRQSRLDHLMVSLCAESLLAALPTYRTAIQETIDHGGYAIDA